MMPSRSRVQAPAVLEISTDPDNNRLPWDEVPEVDIESSTTRGPIIQIHQPREKDVVSSSDYPVERKGGLPAYLKPASLEAQSSTQQSQHHLSRDINRIPDSPNLASSFPSSDYQRPPSPHQQVREPQDVSLRRMQDAVRFGDWTLAEQYALLLLSKVQTRDADGVLGIIGGDKDTLASQPNSLASEATTVVGSKEAEDKANVPMTFSPYITVVEPKRTGDYITEQPLMCEASKNRRGSVQRQQLSSALLTPETHDVDIPTLRDLILAVSRHATRATETEPRMLEISLPCYVLGDIHGNLSDLEFFARTLWPAGADAAAGNFLFLGDFVDRGKDSVAVVAYVMAMKVLHQKKWLAIRGNHETREVNGNVEHYQDGSFLRQCLRLFGEADGTEVWEAVNEFFDVLPLAAIIDDRIFCVRCPVLTHVVGGDSVHGGIPATLNEPEASLSMIQEIECPLRTAQHNRLVYDMLWSDPATPEQERGDMDQGGFGLSPRGCACFGEVSIEAFLAKYKLQHIFRGHEAQKMGVGVSKGNRLTTIFSTSKDHFQGDPSATCGCVLVEEDSIKPIVRSKSHAQHRLSLVPTYVGQSVEATELSVLQADHRVLSPNARSAVPPVDYANPGLYGSHGSFTHHPAHYQPQAQYHTPQHQYAPEEVQYLSYAPPPLPPQQVPPQSWPAQYSYQVRGRQY